MSRIINVLDHGHIRLLSYMQPVPDDCDVAPNRLEGASVNPQWTGDLEIVRNARISYDAAWRTGEDEGADERLLKYMMKHNHSTPFEAMTFTFEVQAPIMVFRQWHRHRTQSYNELSARYAELDLGFYTPNPELIGKQSTVNKQARDVDAKVNVAPLYEGARLMKEHHIACFNLYQKLLNELGWPRELARGALNVFAYSKMNATLNLHNLFHFLSLRLDPHAQYEIRVYAEAMFTLIEPIVPISARYFMEKIYGFKDNQPT